MTQFRVSDIEVGRKDFTGLEILTVYGKVSGKLNDLDCGRYAVYRTALQVMVQFSDDDAEGISQRAALTTIIPLRSQIMTMVSKMYKDSCLRQREKADEYASRLGFSLLIALQGNQQLAENVMTTIRDDLVEDNASNTRTQHLIWASVASLISIFIAALLGSPWFVNAFSGLSLDHEIWPNSWHAAAAGSIGALFSIALQIRARQVRIDSRQWDNIIDAVLRIFVGATSGAILAALFLGHFVNVSIGSNEISEGGYGIMIIAFAGGFAERLIAEFLATIVLTSKPGRSATNSAAPLGVNELNLSGKAGVAGAAPNVISQTQTSSQNVQPAIFRAGSPVVSSEQAIEPDEDQEEADGGDDIGASSILSKPPPLG